MTRPTTAPGLHHIAVRVRDFNASEKFYAALGFSKTYAWQPDATRRIALLDAGDGNYVEIISGQAVETEGALMHFALRTSDAAGDYQKAIAAGATPHIEPKSVTLEGSGPHKEHPVVVHLAFCKGPDGEIIEFFQNDTL